MISTYLAGALDARTGRFIWVEGPRKTSPLFLDLLDRLVTRTDQAARRVHVILDNDGLHDGLQVRLAPATEKGYFPTKVRKVPRSRPSVGGLVARPSCYSIVRL
jgi:hypothetical protein